jgi:hypothetical protein
LMNIDFNCQVAFFRQSSSPYRESTCSKSIIDAMTMVGSLDVRFLCGHYSGKIINSIFRNSTGWLSD